MTIKLKNKSEISVYTNKVYYGTETCGWTGKTIKEGKTYFYSHSTYAAYGKFCSASALKAASNAAL